MRLRFEVVFPHVVLLLNLVVDLWYLGHENQRSSQGRSISCSATYAKLPSFYACILSFYGNPNTCQWWKQFYGNILLSWICFSGHFGFSSDKDDRLIAIFWITSVRVIQNFQKSPSFRGTEPMYPGILWKGFTTMSQLEDKVSLVDKTKVDSLLLISQSPLTVEDLNMSCSLG